MTEISVEKLPGIPRIWIDYAAGLNHALLPEPFDLNSVNTRAKQIRSDFFNPLHLTALAAQGMLLGSDDSIRRLQSAGSVAVVTTIYPSLFGGPASQIWKCLMAIKACEEMAKRGISAAPVGVLSLRPRSDIPPLSIELLDAESELRSLSVPAQHVELINEIRKLGSDSYSEEVLELIADTCPAGDGFAGAALRLLSNIMKPWGMLFLDMPAVAANHGNVLAPLQSRIRPEAVRERESSLIRAGYSGDPEGDGPESLLCSFVLPAIARVVDPHELFSFCGALPAFDELGMVRPLAWPYSGVTLADTRSRRILEKYNLQIFDLFSGERGAIERLLDSSAADLILAKLDGLNTDAEQTLSQVRERTGGREDIEKDEHSCREKVLYQIQKLRRRFESARQKREEAVSRQIHRACNLLAPRGRTQGQEISGVYFLLRYTQTMLQSVLDRLSAFNFQHQLISME